jgi:hypothetical protein
MYRRVGQIALLGMLAASICGLWRYFHLAGFRNKQYPMPMREIAPRILARSAPGTWRALVDSANSGVFGLQYALGGSRAPLGAGDADGNRAWGNG